VRINLTRDRHIEEIEDLACSRFSKIAALLRIATFCVREVTGQLHIAVAAHDTAANARFLAPRPEWLHACRPNSIGEMLPAGPSVHARVVDGDRNSVQGRVLGARLTA
jgi:hypothetical protein